MGGLSSQRSSWGRERQPAGWKVSPTDFRLAARSLACATRVGTTSPDFPVGQEVSTREQVTRQLTQYHRVRAALEPGAKWLARRIRPKRRRFSPGCEAVTSRGGLENRCGRKSTEGSNPSLSAKQTAGLVTCCS